MGKTKIDWCDQVWNPVTGCYKVSQGCKFCYANDIANRFWAASYPPNPDGTPRKFTDVRYHMERLEQPARWVKPQRVFVNSMSDLFHPEVPFEFILRVWLTMAQTPQHQYLILTKRPERMMRFVSDWLPGAWGLATMTLRPLNVPLPNVWLGVSVENQEKADERIPLLLRTPAAVRFASAEPLIGPLDLRPGWISAAHMEGDDSGWLDWAIAGCESGPHRRPMNLDWARSLRDQCQAAGVPFFLKQMEVDGRIQHTPELDGRRWVEFPEFPTHQD